MEIRAREVPRCGAWPMAAKLPTASSRQVDIRLRCPQCGHQEGGRFRRADYGRSFAEQRPQAGR
jgi:hypothetical protein